MHLMKQRVILPVMLLATACTMLEKPPQSATASLKNPAGEELGLAIFTRVGQQLRVDVKVSSISEGLHGMHIHTSGSCKHTTDPEGKQVDFGSAGGHFDPGKSNTHASPMADNAKGHAGDLPNIEVMANGKGSLNVFSRKISLEGTNNIIGRSVIVHADPDDYVTQPSGNSGPRILCGVIQANK